MASDGNGARRATADFRRICRVAVGTARLTAAIAAAGIGCEAAAPPRSVRVPPGSDHVRAGVNRAFALTADRDGTAYVWNDDEQSLIYKGAVKSGQEVIVDPKENVVKIDGKPVSNGKLLMGASYQIWLNK